ncbi:glycine cleavage system protein GcvH [Desulfobacterota bacterium AH_259_B03_O07]|nr:glycine cleavage system protein GcvH [Desulfobacterota bacterium AH_259_B03_O07]
MIEIPEDLRYTDEHEWIRVEGDIVIIGITDYAQDALGEIVYIELPSEGDEIAKGNSFGGVESTKSVSDLYAPVSGEVVEINEALLDSPETINEDPYGGGWMIKVSIHHSDEIGKLMTNKEYAEFIEREVES